MPDTAAIAALPRRRLTMNDGAELSLIDVGSGPALIILPSWTNSAAQYHHQVTELATDHRVIAVDVRAGGLSAKTDFGLRISRFSVDLREICAQLAIAPTILMGHSMGCSIIWSYLDLFGPQQVDALILVDQAPTQLIQPGWSVDEALSYGATQTAEDVFEFAARFAAPDGVDWTWRRYRPLFTQTFPGGRVRLGGAREPSDAAEARSQAFPRSCHARLARCHLPDSPADAGGRRGEERVPGGVAGVDRPSDTGRPS